MSFYDRYGRHGAVLTRFIGGFLLLLTLQACGKSSNDDTPTAVVPPVATAGLSTLIVVAGSVPQGTRTAITQLATPLATSPANAATALAISQGDGDTLVMGLDASGSILLASMTTGSNTSMDASSTTLALARLMVGTVPEGHSVEQLNTAIRASDSFNGAVSAVQEAHTSATAPARSTKVTQLLAAVTRQALIAVEGMPVVATAGSIRTLSITQTRVELPTPFVVLGGQRAGVFVTEGGVFLTNTVPVVWSAISSAAPATNKLLESASVKQGIGFAALGAGDFAALLSQVPKTKLVNDGGKAFEVTVMQNDQSRTANIEAITADAFSVLLGYLGAKKAVDGNCVAGLTQATFRPTEMAELIRTPSGEFLGKYLAATGVREIAEALVKCADGAKVINPRYTQAALLFLADTSGAAWSTDGIGLAAKIGAVVAFWDTAPRTVGICESQGPGGYSIVNCAVRIEVDPLTLTPGAVADITIRSYDRLDKPTARSAGLRVVPSEANNGTIQVDQNAMTVTGLREGLIGIEVKDEELGLSKVATVEVIEPVFVPATRSLASGAQTVIALRRFGNTRVILPKTGLEFTSSNPSVAEFNIITSLFLDRGEVSLTGKSPGAATIQATHPLWKTRPSAAITVTGGESAFRQISYTPTECKVGTFQYITNGQRAFLRQDFATVYESLCRGYSFPSGSIYVGPGHTRLEHAFGCEGLPNVTFDRGSGLSFALAYPSSMSTSNLVFSGATSSTDTSDSGVYSATGTFFDRDLNAPSGTPFGPVSFSASGTWTSGPVPAFSKCLAPRTPQSPNLARFCPSISSGANDTWGCDYRNPRDPPRPGDWEQ